LFRIAFFQFFHGYADPVASPRNRLDVFLVFRGLAKLAPEREHVLRRIALFHMRVGPHGTHQVLLGYHLAAVLDQYGQRLECLRRELDQLPFPAQGHPVHVQDVRAEFKETSSDHRHAGTNGKLRNS
jgi:hypothetical protein